MACISDFLACRVLSWKIFPLQRRKRLFRLLEQMLLQAYIFQFWFGRNTLSPLYYARLDGYEHRDVLLCYM